MKKFECNGCGGSLIAADKFYVCENCRTKYLLGKDDEGNPFTYIPIEKKQLSHDEIAHKASQISVNTITVREIKLNDSIVSDVHKEAMSIDAQDNVRLIRTFLEHKEWDAAQSQINQLLLENVAGAEAQWLGMMCERKVSTDKDLLYTFSNFTEAERIRLDKILGDSSPTFARRVLNILIEGSYANDEVYCSVLSLILPYVMNESVFSAKEYTEKIAYSFGKTIDKSYCNSFDYLIANALKSYEVDKYIQYMEQFADKLSLQKSKKYYARILEVDPANIRVHRKLVKADIKTDETIEKSLSDFENLLKHSSNSDKETYDIISIIKSFDPTTSIKSDLMWNVIGYHSAAPEGLKSEILEYATILIHSSLWNQARNYLNLILSFDAQNAEAYWGLCLVALQARNYSDVMTKKDNLIDRPEFKKCLALYQHAGNKKQSDKLMALTQKQKSAKKARKVSLWVGIAVVSIVVIGIGSVIGPKIIKAIAAERERQAQIQLEKNQKAYDEAMDLLKSGEYQDAYEAFSNLGDFKDSKRKMQYAEDMIEELEENYSDAINLYKAGKYTDALDAFTALDGYEDSLEYIEKCQENIKEKKYSEAVRLYEDGKYEEAIKLFQSLDGYKDSKSRLTDCENSIKEQKYNEAIRLYEAGKYEEAIEMFESLNGYKDCKNKIIDCENAIKEQKYNEAVGLYESEKYEEALKLFESLNGYKDSKDKISDCKAAIKEQNYQKAVELFNDGHYKEATKIFSEIKDYKDSSNYIWRVSVINANVGDTFYFGTYEQDNNTSNGQEPIEWIVISKDDDEVLVISKYVLDKIPYSTATAWNDISWEYSYAREWLNDDFLDIAFDEDEIEWIIPSTVELDEIVADVATPGNETEDMVFILGLSEFEEYSVTNAVAKDNYTSYSGSINIDAHGYWVRHRRWIEPHMVPQVLAGKISFKVADEYAGVRPAMWIEIPD